MTPTGFRDGDPPPLTSASDPASPPVALVRGEASPRRVWLVAAALWTSFGLAASAVGSMTGPPPNGVGLRWWQILLVNLPWWLGWAAATPLVAWLAGRVRLDDPATRARAVLVHLVAALGVTAAHLAVTVTLTWIAVVPLMAPNGVIRTRPLGRIARNYVDSYFALELFTYVAVLGVFYAVDYHRRHKESALLSARLRMQAAELRMHAAEARLRALRMELNPHFLFNSLNAISGLVRKQQGDQAVRMLARLGDLLRATLDRDRGAETSLGEELELLGLYLDIERVRFGERLRVELDVDPAAAEVLVPTLVLQPLVENAVRHGVSRRPAGGVVRVAARLERDRLHLEVRDSGGGFRLVGGRPREGIGLSNTRARLDEHYGGLATLAVGNAPAEEGGGARVLLSLPARSRVRDALAVAGD